MIIAIIIFLYIIMGIVLSGILYGYDNRTDNNSDSTYSVLIIMMWPLILLILIGLVIFNLSKKLGRFIYNQIYE